jgi:hypothetical protein
LEDYEQLISEHRQDDQSISSIRDDESITTTTTSPILPPAKRTRTSKRDSSPANSVAESITSTPEPDEGNFFFLSFFVKCTPPPLSLSVLSVCIPSPKCGLHKSTIFHSLAFACFAPLNTLNVCILPTQIFIFIR